MNKKGFTIVELLAAIIIIAILGVIGIVSYRSVFKTAEERYFNTLESNMLLAGNDYFEDHRGELPIGSEYKEVTLATLVDGKYIEDVTDTEGKSCESGSVFVFRENKNFKYEACLKCGNYESEGRFCNTVARRIINVKGKKKGSSTYDYDVLKSFSSQQYSDGKNIIVNVSMAPEFNAVRYEAINTHKTSYQTSCVANNNSCDMEIAETGVYRVIAYDNEDKEISSRYINIKIAKNGSNFSLDGDTEYLINKNECSNGVKTKKVTMTIVPSSQEEYKRVEYQINGGETQELLGLKFEKSLESGHYEIDFIVTNYANNVSVRKIFIDVSYLMDIAYSDGSPSATHEVIKGQPYNFLSSLKNSKIIDGRTIPIRWYKGSSLINPDTDLVTNDCTFTLQGVVRQTCDKPTNVKVTSAGVVTWTPSSNCSTFQHQISLDGTTWVNATSGVNKHDDLVSTAGERTVYVKAVAPNDNYETSEPGTSKVNVYTVTLSKDTGINTVTINNQSISTKRFISGEKVTLGATPKAGYNFSKWNNSSTEVSTTNNYSANITSNWTYTAVSSAASYTLTYEDNLFTAMNRTVNGVKVTYTENGSYLTLNGTLDTTSMSSLWNLERRDLSANDKYQITIKYISGSMSLANTSEQPSFVLDLTTDGSNFSDRMTQPRSTVSVKLPTTGSNTTTITVDSTRATANGLKYWIWQNTASNATFSNYKVQILVSKVHSKSVTYLETYGTLDTPTKSGYKFNGWYTAVTGGTKITSTSTYSPTTDQTLYAQWTSNKLKLQFNGNGSNVTWCSTSTTYGMDSNKYTTLLSSSSVYTQTVAYGQYLSETSGLSDYHNTGYFCFEKIGHSAPAGNEWIINGKTKTYNQSDKTLTSQTIADDSGCNLATTATCDVRLNVNWKTNDYKVSYVDNLFAATTQKVNETMITFTENGSYLTLDGTPNVKSFATLWNLEKRSFAAGDQYKITITHVSGTMSLNNTSEKPGFVFELTNNGSNLENRGTSPKSYVVVSIPTEGNTTTSTFTVDSTRTNADGLKYWLWESTASNATFANYKLQIVITKVHSKNVAYQGKYGDLDTPTKTGYDFKGWYTAVTGGTKITSTSTYSEASESNIYAQWTPHKLNIQYNGNGSDVTWCSTSTTYSMDSDKYEVKSSNRNVQVINYGQYVSYSAGLDNYNNEKYTCFARAGYTAVTNSEWIINGKTKTYGHADTTVSAIGMASDNGCDLKTTSTCTVRLDVNWKANNYTVTYDNNISQMDVWGTSYKSRWTRTYDSNGMYTISSAGAGGWELLYLPITTVANHQYKVTFDYQIPTAYTPLSGYTGIGYQAVNSLANNDLTNVDLVTSYLPKAVTAKTSGTLTFTATNTTTYFVFNFGMAADSVTTTIKLGNVKVYDVTDSKYVFAPSATTQTKTYQSTYGTLPTVSRGGYTFNGWYTEPSGGTKIETSTKYTLTTNQTLYAHWTMGTYSQTYRPNGGTGSNSSETVGYWDIWIAKAANTYSYNGFTFNCWKSSTADSCYAAGGWYYGSAGTGTSRYLDATWNGNTYTITYNANGGTGAPSATTYNYALTGTTKLSSTTPTRPGYTFLGWATSASASTATYAAGASWNLSNMGDTTLYAVWKIANYTLTFDAKGGSVSPTTKSVTYGITYTDLPTPTKTGNTFKGWYGSYNGTASSAVNYGRAYMYTNKISIHFSAYMSDWKNYGRAISCTEGGGWNLEPGTNAINFACYDSGKGYTSATYSSGFNTLSAGWHDFDLIFNGTNAILYIDGSKKATSANYTSGKIGYHTGNSIFIGGEATGSATSASTPNFEGYVGNLVIKNTDAITPSTTYNSITAPAQNQTLYAKWIPNTYTITYDANTGSNAPAATKYTYADSGTTNITSSTPTKDGYSFLGWSTDKSATTATYTAGQAWNLNNAANYTLYAVWSKNSYYLDLNGVLDDTNANNISGYGTCDVYINGKLASDNVADYYAQHPYGTSYEIKDCVATTGHTYVGISTNNGKGTIGAGNVSVRAQFSTNSYTITYNANGGSGAPGVTTYTYAGSGTTTLSATSPTRTGYTFLGWSTNKSATTAAYEAGSAWSLSNAANYTLYAVWSINSYYLDLNGVLDGTNTGNIGGYGTCDVYINGKLVSDDVTDYYVQQPYGTTYEIKGCKATTGHTYDSISTNNASGTIGTANVSVRAKFTTNSYTITYNANGGSGAPGATTYTYATSGTTTLSSTSPTRTGYTFLGWSTDKSATTASYAAGSAWSLSNASNYTLYAVWSVTNYTISYTLNGGSVSGNSTSYNVNTAAFTLKNPTRTGYTFIGWVGSNDLSSGLPYTTSSPYTAGGRDHPIGNEFNVSSGTTYRVIITAKRTKGTVDLRGGLFYTAQTSGDAWQGYNVVFTYAETLSDGWARYYRDVTVPSGKTKAKVYIQLEQSAGNFTTSWNIADIHVVTSPTSVSIPKGSTGNKSYAAAWTRNSYTVTYKPNGGSGSNTNQTVTYSVDWTTKPALFTRDGYSQSGWSTSSTGSLTHNLNTAQGAWTGTGNLDLYATWSANTYTVTFDARGGTVSPETKNYTYGGTYSSLPTPTRDGYKFIGWYTSATNGFDYKFYADNHSDLYQHFGYNATSLLNHWVDNGMAEGRLSSTTYVKNGMTYSIADNSTLYAHWRPNTYSISYNLNGGSVATANPTSYTPDSSTITLNNPTRSEYVFFGWVGSSDLSSGLPYTTSSPYTAGARDHPIGNEFNVTAGKTYRVIVTAKKTKGSLGLQGGLFYTGQSSGDAWDEYGAYTKIDTLSDSWERYYRDVKVPSGKTKAKVYIQLEQTSGKFNTSWDIADVHVIEASTTTKIPSGSIGAKSYTAIWKSNPTTYYKWRATCACQFESPISYYYYSPGTWTDEASAANACKSNGYDACSSKCQGMGVNCAGTCYSDCWTYTS